MTAFTECIVEDAALAWLEASGWRVAHGPDIAPDQPLAERRDSGEVVLAKRLRDALAQNRGDAPGKTKGESRLRIGMRNCRA